MGIIAWILLGLVSGLLAQRLLPGTIEQGLVFNCVAGAAGALSGGWVAVSVLHAQALNALFGIPAWLAALLGAAIFLLASRTLTEGFAGPRARARLCPCLCAGLTRHGNSDEPLADP